MKTSLNKSKRKKGSMTKPKETTIHDVEGMILERLNILQNGETKEQKKKARSEIIKLERHIRDVQSKYQNGHKYPERMKGFPDDKPMNVKEVLKLIESGFPEDKWRGRTVTLTDLDYQLFDVTGGSPIPGEQRFKFEDKGWSKPKEMKPVHLFK